MLLMLTQEISYFSMQIVFNAPFLEARAKEPKMNLTRTCFEMQIKKRLHLLNNILALGKGLADQRVRNVLPLVFLQQVQTFSLFANTVSL